MYCFILEDSLILEEPLNSLAYQFYCYKHCQKIACFEGLHKFDFESFCFEDHYFLLHCVVARTQNVLVSY